MSKATLAHLFEPFFTTKRVGEGTGLGLATVYGIVKQSGGHIRVYSEPGHGTTFKIYLPRLEDETPPCPSAPGCGTLAAGTETVLLVEDEVSVRSLSRFILQQGGYKVLEACDGQEALEVVARHNGPIDLLVTDVEMPKMGGHQLAEALRLLHTNLRVLFVSGYTEDAAMRHGISESQVAFLHKPFTIGDLARKIRTLLDGQGSSV
jgi:CheY-like chemotaxis protein